MLSHYTAPKICERVDAAACAIDEAADRYDIDLLDLVHQEAGVETIMDDEERDAIAQEVAIETYQDYDKQTLQAASKIVECIRCQACPMHKLNLPDAQSDPDQPVISKN